MVSFRKAYDKNSKILEGVETIFITATLPPPPIHTHAPRVKTNAYMYKRIHPIKFYRPNQNVAYISLDTRKKVYM